MWQRKTKLIKHLKMQPALESDRSARKEQDVVITEAERPDVDTRGKYKLRE